MVFILQFRAPTGVPWSEYIRSQRNRSRSVSSSTEALDSDHARYITSPDSPACKVNGHWYLDLYLLIHLSHTSNQLKEDNVSQGVPSDIGSAGDVPHRGMQIPTCHANLSEIPHITPGGIEYHPIVLESDRLSTYTGLDDYDTLFEARHGTGALDNMPRTNGEAIVTSSIGMTPVSLSVGVIENPMVRMRPIPDSGLLPTSQKVCVSVSADPSMIGHRVVSPISFRSHNRRRCCHIH